MPKDLEKLIQDRGHEIQVKQDYINRLIQKLEIYKGRYVRLLKRQEKLTGAKKAEKQPLER